MASLPIEATETDFQVWREQRDWTERKYAAWTASQRALALRWRKAWKPEHYFPGRLPAFNGRGAASPRRGTLKNSEISEPSANASFSRIATVGFSRPRSSRLT